MQSAQLEVTLIVLLRLGEDVFIPLDSHIQTQRKKSIEQGLNEKMNDVFSFFIKALQENVGAWRRSVCYLNVVLKNFGSLVGALGKFKECASSFIKKGKAKEKQKQVEKKGLKEVAKNLNATSRLCLVFYLGT